MYSEEAWVLVPSGTLVQPQIVLDPDYLPDYLSVSYDYLESKCSKSYLAYLLIAMSLLNII